MKLTEQVPFIRVDGTIGKVDYGIALNQKISELFSEGLITRFEHLAIAERLHDRYRKEVKEYGDSWDAVSK